MRSSGRLAGETGCRTHIRRVVTENGCGVRMRLSAAVAAGDKALLPALTSAPPRVCMMSPTQGASAHLSMKAPFNLGSSTSCVGNGCVSCMVMVRLRGKCIFFFHLWSTASQRRVVHMNTSRNPKFRATSIIEK